MGQPARRRLDQRDCRARASSTAIPGRTLRRRSYNGRRVRGRSRPVHSLCPLLRRLLSKSAAGDRWFRCAGAHRSVLAPMERSLFRCWALDGSGQTLAHHAEGADLCPDGGIVAAATTSLPERLGGVRNWDYRYCWLRDATFTLLALMSLGYHDEAQAWRDWLIRAVAGSPSQVQIMYGVGGERWLPELIVRWLPGYENSAPMRIGNDASKQLQLDVYGEIADAMFQALKAGIAPSERGQAVRPVVLNYLATAWREPDEGICGGPPRPPPP